jgi:hypothetical protein
MRKTLGSEMILDQDGWKIGSRTATAGTGIGLALRFESGWKIESRTGTGEMGALDVVVIGLALQLEVTSSRKASQGGYKTGSATVIDLALQFELIRPSNQNSEGVLHLGPRGTLPRTRRQMASG